MPNQRLEVLHFEKSREEFAAEEKPSRSICVVDSKLESKFELALLVLLTTQLSLHASLTLHTPAAGAITGQAFIQPERLRLFGCTSPRHLICASVIFRNITVTATKAKRDSAMSVVLAVFAILIASADPASAKTGLTLPVIVESSTQEHARPDGLYRAARFLRTHQISADQDDDTIGEERVFGFKSKSANAERIEEWLRLGQSSDDIFTEWKEYVGVRNKDQSPEMAMITILMEKYDTEPVAEMLQAAKTVSATKTIATRLEKAQFETWYKQGLKPATVIDDMFGGKFNVVSEQAKADYRTFLTRSHPE
ncbi:hypothetical protein ON010_g1663 [Phytophthora cinnamomi]|nr:hypothetical protein ON010_g1663 [Phytophthora cinnamomi]